jgi:uncharacterized lipoprotein NlpE involved in copper resistance
MKRIMVLGLAVCVMFAVGFILTGCNNNPGDSNGGNGNAGNGNGGNNNTAANPIVGTWLADNGWLAMEVNADGSVINKQVEGEGFIILGEGTWTVSGNKITTLFDPDDIGMSITDIEFELSNNNNTLTFKALLEGGTEDLVYTRIS